MRPVAWPLSSTFGYGTEIGNCNILLVCRGRGRFEVAKQPKNAKCVSQGVSLDMISKARKEVDWSKLEIAKGQTSLRDFPRRRNILHLTVKIHKRTPLNILVRPITRDRVETL